MPAPVTLWQTPAGAFSALNPPRWLQHELQRAEQYPAFTDMRTLVFFADDLNPDKPISFDDLRQARVNKLESMATACFGQGLACLNLNHGMAQHYDGEYDCNVDEQALGYAHPVFGRQHKKLLPEDPLFALILLPEKKRDAASYLFPQAPQAHRHLAPDITNERIHRVILWHELGHLRQIRKMTSPMTLKACEADADTFSFAHSNPQLATDMRQLNTFLSAATPKATHYWNCLSLQDPAVAEIPELAAYIEVKLRGVNRTMATANSLNLLQDVFQHNAEPALAAYGEPAEPGIFLNNLAQNHALPYALPHSRQLADGILAARRRLLPTLL